jgi:hypothetical protein
MQSTSSNGTLESGVTTREIVEGQLSSVALLIMIALVPFGFQAIIYINSYEMRQEYEIRQEYAKQCGVPVNAVTIEKEPHDCEFLSAPMGSKHCHYVGHSEKRTSYSNQDYVVVWWEKKQD